MAQHRVGHTDDGDLGDVGMLEQRALDLDRVDVVAPAQHHVLLPVDDEQVALVVETTEITREHPAVAPRAGGAVGVVVVRAPARGQLERDLAHLTGRHLALQLVDDADLDTGHGPPDRARAVQGLTGREHAHAVAALGEAVALGERRIRERSRERLDGRGWRGRTAEHHDDDRRRVAVAQRARLEQEQDVRRHHQHEHGPLALDELGEATGLERGLHDARHRQPHRCELGADHTGERRERHGVQERAPPFERLHRMMSGVVVGRSDALRQAGGTRRVEDVGWVVAVDVDPER